MNSKILPFMLRLMLLYMSVVFVFMALENLFIFPATWPEWTDRGIPEGVVEQRIDLDESRQIYAWYSESDAQQKSVMDNRKVILAFHGNGEHVNTFLDFIPEIQNSTSCDVLLVEYPGFGLSEGVASEGSLYLAARKSYDWLINTKGYQPDHVIIFGRSLGTAVSTQLALQVDHLCLILDSPFLSAPKLGRHLFPYLPTEIIVRNRFETENKIHLVQHPVLIVHGTADTLVPIEHGKTLASIQTKALKETQLFQVEGMGHDSPRPSDVYEEISRFIQTAGGS